MNTLGGVVFCIDAVKYDYTIRETIECLSELCDEVVVLDAGSSDSTLQLIAHDKPDNVLIVSLNRSLWEEQQGKEKLAYFQNLAKSFLDTDYYIVVQADECIPEWYFPIIRKAVDLGRHEGFLMPRRNFWKDANHFLTVPENRQPCSTSVVRIAKLKYDSVGDGESIEVPEPKQLFATINHYGFIRDKIIMKDKVFNIQENIFQIPHDPKLDGIDYFEWSRWFSEDDLDAVFEGYAHPKFMNNWLKDKL